MAHISISKFNSLISLVTFFKDNRTCTEFTIQQRWCDGDSYTNTIEGFWAQLKRSIFGIYHFVSAKYLQRYVDESVFRYNTKDKSEGDRFEIMFTRSIGIFRYADVKNVA